MKAFLATLVLVLLAVLASPPASDAAKVHVNLEAEVEAVQSPMGAWSEWRLNVRAVAGRIAAPTDAGCRKSDLLVSITGPTKLPTQLLGRTFEQIAREETSRAVIAQGLPIVVELAPRYRPQVDTEATVSATAQCQGLNLGGDQKQLTVIVPGHSRTRLPPVPKPEPPPGNDPKEGLNQNHEAATKGSGATAAMACAAGNLIPYPGVKLALKGVCAAEGASAIGNGVVWKLDPPDPSVSDLYSADFPLARFAPARRELIACRRVRRGRARRICPALNDSLRRYLWLTRERAWLARAAAVSANRLSSARALPSGEPIRDPAIALHQTAIRVYAARLVQVADLQRQMDTQVATRIVETGLNRVFGLKARRRALRAFTSGRTFPKSVRRDFARDGMTIRPTLRLLARELKPRHLPRSVKALFRSPRLPRTVEDVFGNGQVSYRPSTLRRLLAIWTGRTEPAQQCGPIGTWPTVGPDASSRYGQVLALTLLIGLGSTSGTECEAQPDALVPNPLPGYEPGPRRVVAPAPGATPLGHATDVHLTRSGEILIPDAGHQVIWRYGLDGTARGLIGGPGTGAGQFLQPGGVTSDSQGRIYVSDIQLNRIQRFSATGDFELSWGATGSEPGQLDGPAGLAVMPGGDVVVADSRNQRLQIFTPDGHQPRVITAAPSPQPGALQRARGLAVAPDGSIAVADTVRNRIVRYWPDGRLAGETSQTLGLVEPYDIAFDSAGRAWVADRAGGQLLRLAGWNAVDRRIKSVGPLPAAQLSPWALAATDSGPLVLDWASQRLLMVPIH
jgi:sugar lactone lactonase YvrE